MRWVSGVIERQVGLMTRLVDDLLDVSRITSGKIVLQRGPVAVKSVIAQAVEAARPPAEARRLALEIDVDADVGQVDGGPARLGQAVGNLLDNPIKYTEEDGRVQVEARAAEEDVVISVRDTGVGIAPDLLPHVFELFTQGDRSLERRRGGLGIGLTLVRRLVEMHGGHVDAASEGEGRGSTFTIRLPRLRSAASAPAEVSPDGGAPAPPPGPARRMLVVDDQPDSTDSLAMLLRLRGHEVWTATDGPSALGEFARVRPDVVFLDLGLPGMRRLRRGPPAPRLARGPRRAAGGPDRLRHRIRSGEDPRGGLRRPPGQAGGPAGGGRTPGARHLGGRSRVRAVRPVALRGGMVLLGGGPGELRGLRRARLTGRAA